MVKEIFHGNKKSAVHFSTLNYAEIRKSAVKASFFCCSCENTDVVPAGSGLFSLVGSELNKSDHWLLQVKVQAVC